MKKKMKRILSVALMLFMIIGSLPLLSFAKETQIPEDAVEFNGHYYKAYDQKLAWHTAKTYCEELGGHLATITSKEENDFVYEMVRKNGISYWLGGTDEEQEGVWKWVTGEEWSFDNSGFDNRLNNQDYLVMNYLNNNVWDDQSDIGDSFLCNVSGFICEWESKTTPNGYNFLEDSYQFSNFGTYISKKYFTTMFGQDLGTEIWKVHSNQGGVCFGMSYTTALFYNSKPDAKSIIAKPRISQDTCSNLRGAFTQSEVNIGGKKISVLDYIRYAHIYQFGPEYAENSVWSDISTIYGIVKNYFDNNQIGVTIGMTRNDGTGGHRVLAVGIDGNDILVDDPNNTSSPERIEMGDNGYWSFSGLPGWSSDTCRIRYSSDTYMPYETLLTGKTLGKTDENEEENYVIGMDTLAKDKLLLTVENSNSEIDSNDILEIIPEYFEENSTETAKQYWLMNDKSISVSNTGGEENEVRLAGNGSVLTASVSDNSDVTMTLDGQKAETKIDTVCGNEYTVSVIDFNDAEEAIEAKITGTAAKDTVTATKTEDGVTVSGLSDITITYLKDDTEFADAKADAPDGQETDISIDENDNISVTEEKSACNHICHKGGISKVFYKIARFFWKLFKINKYCSCGAAHY